MTNLELAAGGAGCAPAARPQQARPAAATLSERIDRIALHPWLGLPVFLAVMYVMFLFTQSLGGCFIDFFSVLAGGVFVEGLGELLESLGCPEWLRVLAADGLGGGVQTVSTFIP
ncbi:MAG: ferrous iron transporter B, partial [Duodenibacillus sp.]|nr:ferrous iron transporter B [Duodenibacillus sp.]